MYYLFRYIPAFFNIHILFLVKIMDDPIWYLCFVFILKLFGPKLHNLLPQLQPRQLQHQQKFTAKELNFFKTSVRSSSTIFSCIFNLLSSHSFFVSIKFKMVLLLCVNKETNWSNLFYSNANNWLLYCINCGPIQNCFWKQCQNNVCSVPIH